MNDRILLIRTGGTIDAKPYDDPRNPPSYVETLQAEDSLINVLLATSKQEDVDQYSWVPDLETQFVKDSQLFDGEDIQALANIIRNDDHRFFILTHGTDAMIKNATALDEALKGSGKTVMFAGAMVPLSMGDKAPSDGTPAVDFALREVKGAPPGVYVVGRDAHTKRLEYTPPQEVTKDRKASLKDLTFTLSHRR